MPDSPPDKVSEDELQSLIELLELRIKVIRDQELRENHPDEQLRQLQEVSESLMAWHQEKAGRLSPRLKHFMEGCSYEKALAWAKGGNG